MLYRLSYLGTVCRNASTLCSMEAFFVHPSALARLYNSVEHPRSSSTHQTILQSDNDEVATTLLKCKWCQCTFVSINKEFLRWISTCIAFIKHALRVTSKWNHLWNLSKFCLKSGINQWLMPKWQSVTTRAALIWHWHVWFANLRTWIVAACQMKQYRAELEEHSRNAAYWATYESSIV